MIKKIRIINFKKFKDITIELNKNLNIIVGNNEEGKSTILEAINLALTGFYRGKPINNELSQYLFNNDVVFEYLNSLQTEKRTDLPCIKIEIYFSTGTAPIFEGNKNIDNEGNEGFTFHIGFNEDYREEYDFYIRNNQIDNLPIEYYEVWWETFARDKITTKKLPIKSFMIDSSNYKYTNSSDIYISRIVNNILDKKDILSIAQSHRRLKYKFSEEDSIKNINSKISKDLFINDDIINLGVEVDTKNAWQNSLVVQVNDIPFENIGKGTQCIFKTKMSLLKNKDNQNSVILIEEPENHLSYSKLNEFIKIIENINIGKQIIMTTHSSFVANKLGLNNLILINDKKVLRINNVKSFDFFKKIPGYDTLRFLLSKRVILVEGPSDELVVQKAYMMHNNGKIPIMDGIDVISVGTAFLRYLELAIRLNIKVSVMIDNDGNIEAIEKKYSDYKDNKNITICYDEEVNDKKESSGERVNYNTLEPNLLKVNSIEVFNKILNTSFTSKDKLLEHMHNNKTDVALKIFETKENINFPSYILKAIDNEE